jgi:hypothetical protein
MGKKSKYKQMRRIASALPGMQTKGIEVSKVSGDELLKRGVVELSDGTPVFFNKDYKEKKQVPVAMNHYRKMKKIYNSHSAAHVNGYIKAVRDIAAKRDAVQVSDTTKV